MSVFDSKFTDTTLQSRVPDANHDVPQKTLDILIERDETPEIAPGSINKLLSTPLAPSSSPLKEQLAQLTSLNTPKTLPRPAPCLMSPKDVHQTTTKAPDSGLKLGFGDITTKKSTASTQYSPTKHKPRESLPAHLTAQDFEFKYASDSHLSNEAQKLMQNVREEAERIKAEMLRERDEQDKKDEAAEQEFNGVSAAGRKLAQPKGKAGRFSDVHKAQFRKMDSIANHASSFRKQPGFAAPTQQSLKRSSSKANLDEQDRPNTPGKTLTGRAPVTTFVRQTNSVSPFKPIPQKSDRLENSLPAKRARKSDFTDVSSARKSSSPDAVPKPADTPKTRRSLFSSTKASLARSGGLRPNSLSPGKSILPRSDGFKSIPVTMTSATKPLPSLPEPSLYPKISLDQQLSPSTNQRPLPQIPNQSQSGTPFHVPAAQTAQQSKAKKSMLPTFAGLKSILRPSRHLKDHLAEASPARSNAGGTPKRINTEHRPETDKKVDFTPSTKSRYAVKLAAASPSPSKIPRAGGSRLDDFASNHALDPASYAENASDDEAWEDAESEVDYPALPISHTSPSQPTIFSQQHAQEQTRRESKEFKSIFTTLHHPSRDGPQTLTSVNTHINKTGPVQAQANLVTRSPSNPFLGKASPSTIRQVRISGVSAPIQAFKDTIKTVPHGLEGKKRRRNSVLENDIYGTDDDAKENRWLQVSAQTGAQNDVDVADEDEGTTRGMKRTKVAPGYESKLPLKKPNAAREAAAKNAKDRKSRGILSMSRLNMLARPKDRN